MDWQKLTHTIREATRTAFHHLRHKYADESFYAYALYTDSSAMTVVPAANSRQALERTLTSDEDLSDQMIRYYKWSTSEWAYEAWDCGAFADICRAVREDRDRSADFATFARSLRQSMINALKDLADEGFFGIERERENVTLFITITDDNRARDIENESARLLNPEIVYEKFFERR
jgi:hypothetical protein